MSTLGVEQSPYIKELFPFKNIFLSLISASIYKKSKPESV